jgi:phosphoglycolate phosphatase
VVKAVLFDFDGTLADSYHAIAASVNHVRAHYGLVPLAVDEVKRHVGRGMPRLLKLTVPGHDPQADAERYRAHHPSVLRSGTTLLPDVEEVLERLDTAGVALAVCSNKPREFTAQLLEILGIAGRFDLVLGPEDVARPKPAPDMLLAGLRRLDVPADRALYVGDMVVDIETARAAGISVWVIPTGSDTRAALEAAHPDRLLQRFGELTELV